MGTRFALIGIGRTFGARRDWLVLYPCSRRLGRRGALVFVVFVFLVLIFAVVFVFIRLQLYMLIFVVEVLIVVWTKPVHQAHALAPFHNLLTMHRDDARRQMISPALR